MEEPDNQPVTHQDLRDLKAEIVNEPTPEVVPAQAPDSPPAQTTETNTQQLQKMANTAQDILIEATTVFPFVLFPDTVTIDRVKLNITRRYFPTSKVNSIQIDDILNAEATVGPLFGSIKLWTRFFNNKPLTIEKLKRDEALMIKSILQGFIIARQKKIDCSKIEKDKLVELLHELGQEPSS